MKLKCAVAAALWAFASSIVLILADAHAWNSAQKIVGDSAGWDSIKNVQSSAGSPTQVDAENRGAIPDIRQVAWQDGVRYKIISSPAYSSYQLRITEPSLCDPSVQQYSGYLDISGERHLFFWFFEARESPQDAPLMMWLNGGPGCSSAMGLFFELGPCAVIDEGNATAYNEHSWNQVANMIFLDEPIGTGFSYSSDGSSVDTLADLAVDVHAFLTLFLTQYPGYASVPFHLAAESWGGHYGPHIASYIQKKNEEIEYAPRPGMKKIDLASLIIGNGLTDPATQFSSIPDFLCGGSPYSPFDPKGPKCAAFRLETSICTNLIQPCYKSSTRLTCNPPTEICWAGLGVLWESTDRNIYDIRVPCETALCYREIDWIEHWMNEPSHKKALGIDTARQFVPCNMTINSAFYDHGQAMRNSAALLPALINGGMRLLVYAGNTDGLCNHMGVERWMSKLEHKFHAEFQRTPSTPWKNVQSGKVGGEVRSAGSGAGNVTFIQVFEAGHMAPHDQPEVTLDMITRWIRDRPFT